MPFRFAGERDVEEGEEGDVEDAENEEVDLLVVHDTQLLAQAVVEEAAKQTEPPCNRYSGECCPGFFEAGPASARDVYHCSCIKPMFVDSRLGVALTHARTSERLQTTDNPLLNMSRYVPFRETLLAYDASCPPGVDFDRMIQSAGRAGVGTEHLVYKLAQHDAALLGMSEAVLRISRADICERARTTAHASYHEQLLDMLTREAWLNVAMGEAGIGPRVHHVCIRRRVHHGVPSLRTFLIMERFPTSVQALLQAHPASKLADEKLMPSAAQGPVAAPVRSPQSGRAWGCSPSRPPHSTEWGRVHC